MKTKSSSLPTTEQLALAAIWRCATDPEAVGRMLAYISQDLRSLLDRGTQLERRVEALTRSLEALRGEIAEQSTPTTVRSSSAPVPIGEASPKRCTPKHPERAWSGPGRAR